MQFKEHFLFRKQQLEKEISALEKFLAHTSTSPLIVRKRNNRYYYSTVNKLFEGLDMQGNEVFSKHERYLRKESMELEALAKRDYSIRRLEDAKKELKLINNYLKIMENESTAEKYLRNHEGVAHIINPLLKPVDSSVKEWLEKPYPTNTFNPEGLIYPTVLPILKTRSKAESDIVGRLVHYEIPFHYEEGILVNGKMFFPDFTCMSLSNHKIFYWEHFGSMDNIKYAQTSLSKLPELYQAGLTMWQNLIVTTETSSFPLDINFVDFLIEYFLL